MKNFKQILYEIGLLNEAHSKSEHIASYVTNGSLLVIFALIPVVAIDEFILNKYFYDYLIIVVKLALFGFCFGCLLIVLATNKII